MVENSYSSATTFFFQQIVAYIIFLLYICHGIYKNNKKMKKSIKFFALAAIACLCFTSCNTYSRSMREPNVKVELYSDDFELSDQFTAEATTTRVFCIDWQRLFGTTEFGEIDGTYSMASVPVIGNIVFDATTNYALYQLLAEHPGYDVIVYPQVEKHVKAPILGTDIFSKTTVKVTARLGKLKK